MIERGVIEAVLVGRARPLARGKSSAIAKSAVEGPVAVTREGLEGDEQADRVNHGGAEKAVHLYPRDHYATWRAELVPPSPLDAPGGFGENLAVPGLTEADACIGDLWRAGTALLQVAQGRQPCWKLNERFGVRDMARRVQESGRTGWYFRVIEPGTVAAGDALALVDRPRPDWTVAAIARVFYHDVLDGVALAAIADLDELSESWRGLARRRLASGRIEDWRGRLGEKAEAR